MSVSKKLEEHILDKLIHQEKYNAVMDQIRVTTDKTLLKKHMASFIQKKDELFLDDFTQESKKIFSNTNGLIENDVTALLQHQTKTYKLLDLGCVPTIEHSNSVTNFLGDKLTAVTIIDNSIQNFLNQTLIKNIPFFDEILVKMAQIFFLRVQDSISVLNLLLDQAPGMEIFSALAIHPFLFYAVGPVAFFNLALPLLTPGNFTFLLKSIRSYCLSLITVVDVCTPVSSILREPLNYGPMTVQKISNTFLNANENQILLRNVNLSSNIRNVVGYWPKPILFGLLSMTIWQFVTTNGNLVKFLKPILVSPLKIIDVLNRNFVFDYVKNIIKNKKI